MYRHKYNWTYKTAHAQKHFKKESKYIALWEFGRKKELRRRMKELNRVVIRLGLIIYIVI
jgi:hypothetical protein